MTAPPRSWRLVRPDGERLGRLVQDGAERSWILCRFEADPGFTAVAELFAEDLGLIEEDEMDAWEMIHERIADLGLVLVPEHGGEPLREFLLHVDGDRAWFRQ